MFKLIIYVLFPFRVINGDAEVYVWWDIVPWNFRVEVVSTLNFFFKQDSPLNSLNIMGDLRAVCLQTFSGLCKCSILRAGLNMFSALVRFYMETLQNPHLASAPSHHHDNQKCFPRNQPITNIFPANSETWQLRSSDIWHHPWALYIFLPVYI